MFVNIWTVYEESMVMFDLILMDLLCHFLLTFIQTTNLGCLLWRRIIFIAGRNARGTNVVCKNARGKNATGKNVGVIKVKMP